ncbi:hypothetical protein CDAR_585661 [Caerostris darwini]|uniref:Uncharacterized protein n=1 Tax=Caerostris darwini TaxID=1538125 RepID=A0AAV4TJ39_9ARAC|nr:hypothetical protein CDAR_585661 [Caerostris darwini]
MYLKIASNHSVEYSQLAQWGSSGLKSCVNYVFRVDKTTPTRYWIRCGGVWPVSRLFNLDHMGTLLVLQRSSDLRKTMGGCGG